jgi:hypothetical protein
VRVQYRPGDGEAIDTTLDRVTANELVGSLPVPEFRLVPGPEALLGLTAGELSADLVSLGSAHLGVEDQSLLPVVACLL